MPLIERKAALKKLLGRRRRGGPIRYSDHVQGLKFLGRREDKEAREVGLESGGKRADMIPDLENIR